MDDAREVNSLRQSDQNAAEQSANLLFTLGGMLGILQNDAEAYLQGRTGVESNSDDAEIESLIQQRNDARANKDWAESDRIRDLFKEKGIVLEDGAQGTTWRRE